MTIDTTPDTMSVPTTEGEDNKAIVRRFIDEIFVRGRKEAVDELLADDFVDHTPFPGVPPTRDGVKMLFGYLRSAFPDLHVRIHEQIADDDRVVFRVTGRGTHRGEFMGRAPTGARVEVAGIDIVRLEGERIAEHWAVFDQFGLLQQLDGSSPASS